MKKIIVVALICGAFIPEVGTAQPLRGFGVKVALTSSTHSIRSYYDPILPPTKRRLGFNIGVFAEWFNLPFVSLVTQVEYDQRGYQQGYYGGYVGPNGPVLSYVNNRIDYLSVPVLAKFKYPSVDPQPYVLIGVRADFKESYHRSIVYDYPTAPPYSQFKSTMLGATVGTGVTLQRVIPIPLLLELRYNFDFADSFFSGNLSMRNNAYDLWMGVEL